MIRPLLLCSLFTSSLVACGEPAEGTNDVELITRVELAFTGGGGPPQVFVFEDLDGDGGAPGEAEPITLSAGVTYALSPRFLNGLEDPAEDITEEVRDEGAEHQVFFTGSAVIGPATTNTTGPLNHTYVDTDVNGLPIGLENTVTTVAGTGELVVTLRHMPAEPPPGKETDSAAQVASGGFTAIGGSSDASVTFPVTVQ